MATTTNTTRPTCGPLYKAALNHYAGGDPAAIRLFAGGFVAGQAEKCYLGACRAAMFRPSTERRAMLLDIVEDVAQRYGLSWFDAGEEIWICRDADAMRELCHMVDHVTPNSREWHVRRGHLCGVPVGEWDERFHERAGHGERCD